MTSTPHDALFKAAFSQPEHAAGVLRAALPPAIVALLDFSSLTLLPGSFVDEALAQSHADLLFSVRLAGRPAFVYLLYEHRSTPHAFMPLRMLKYEARIWDRHLEKNPGARLLPAILPLVLHHGEGGWTAAVAFEELLDLDPAALAVLGDHLPRFRLLIDDLADQDDEALHDRTMSALGRLVLLCFKHAAHPDRLVEHLDRWVDLVKDTWRAPNGVTALGLVVRYLFEIGGPTPVQAFHALAARKVGKDMEKAFVSYADMLRQEGRKRGLQEGRRKGRREALQNLLGARFGALPDPVLARLKSAKLEQLDRWLERILTARTLDDVLAEG
jgi:predicted transposase/invertase (TIGR01784 family)